MSAVKPRMRDRAYERSLTHRVSVYKQFDDSSTWWVSFFAAGWQVALCGSHDEAMVVADHYAALSGLSGPWVEVEAWD